VAWCYVKTKWGATYRSGVFVIDENKVTLFKPIRWIVDERMEIIEPAKQLDEDVSFTMDDIEKITIFSSG